MHASSRKHAIDHGMARGASLGTQTRGPAVLHSRGTACASSRSPFGFVY